MKKTKAKQAWSKFLNNQSYMKDLVLRSREGVVRTKEKKQNHKEHGQVSNKTNEG